MDFFGSAQTVRNQQSGDAEPDYWTYQTCTEFAFFQTCEVGSKCMFTQGLNTLQPFLDACQTWGISKEKIVANVGYSNQYYGALMPAGSRVLYVNGEVDPWRSLSIVKSPGPSLPVLEVPGASHHSWTHPSKPSDQKSVVKARHVIRKQVLNWLEEDDEVEPAIY
jgi:serine protease 16